MLPTAPSLAVLPLLSLCCACAFAAAPRGQEGSAVQQFLDAHGDFARRAVPDPAIQLSASFMPSAQIQSEPGHFDALQGALDATVPLPLDRDSFLILGVEAGVIDVEFDNVQTVADETLYRLGPRLGYGKYLDDDFVVQAYWQPSIYSDLDGTLKSEDYRLWYGTALAVYRQSDDLFWKVGFRLTDAVDSGVIPLGGATWHFAPDWRLEVLLPRNADVRFTVDDHWTVSGGFKLRADEYHIRGPVALGKPEHDVHVQEIVGFVASEYRLTDNLSTQMTVGTTVAGHWDWSYGGGLPKYDGTLEPGLFLEWGVGWRF